MKWILIILAGLAGLAAVAWVAGSLLPREHRVSASVTLSQPLDSVWSVVRNLGALKGTWPELTEVERLPDRDGRETWREKVDGFEMTLLVEEEQPPSRLVTLVDSPPGSAFGGRWIYQLEGGLQGTTVTVTEDGWIGPPPFRLMGAVMGLDRSIRQYLAALERHFTR